MCKFTNLCVKDNTCTHFSTWTKNKSENCKWTVHLAFTVGQRNVLWVCGLLFNKCRCFWSIYFKIYIHFALCIFILLLIFIMKWDIINCILFSIGSVKSFRLDSPIQKERVSPFLMTNSTMCSISMVEWMETKSISNCLHLLRASIHDSACSSSKW